MKAVALPFAALLLIVVSGLPAETDDQLPAEPTAALAISRDDYPVTPGDMYRLTYSLASSMQAAVQTIVVTNDYRVNLGHLGIIDAEGLTFPELRRRVEALVGDAYPAGFTELMIQSIGRFEVFIRGEVAEAGHVQVNGLSRLSSVFLSSATAYASSRAVRVVGRSGAAQTYDLFRSMRDGVVDADPYLRPGDVVTIPRAERRVILGGRVRRPGTYVLLAGETLAELIQRYGDGFALGAGEITVRRFRPDGTYQMLYVDYAANPRFALSDGDRVSVGSAYENAPVIVVSGALYGAAGTGEEPVEIPEQPVLMAVPFMEGLTVRAVMVMLGGPTPYADHEAAVVVREGGRLVRFDALRVWNRRAADIALLAGDRVEVPFGPPGFGRTFGGRP